MTKEKIHTEVLEQLKCLLKNLNPNQYTQKLKVLNGSSLGQHTRHVIEFYLCIIKGINSGVVNYDARDRDLLIENDLIHAMQVLDEICLKIESICNLNIDLNLVVSYPGQGEIIIRTNIIRELVYLVEHSIHHYALLKIGVQHSCENITLPKNFGVAYSTVKYHEHSH